MPIKQWIYREIISHFRIGSLVRHGKNIEIGLAREWMSEKGTKLFRPEVIAATTGNALATEVTAQSDKLPAGTERAVIRDTLHMSDEDPQPHWTVVCFAKGKHVLETLHLYPRD